MIDLMSATQAAVYARLAASVTSATVHDHVPQGTEPNFVKIGHISTSSEGGKSEQAERLDVEIHSIYRGADRSELLAIMHDVREALDQQPIDAEGVNFWLPQFISAGASDAGQDGITYAGISTFEIFAEPA